MVWAVGLDKDFGGFKMAAPDAPDDLGKELKSMFFGGEIRERKAGIGLDDANRGEKGEIETASDSLGADNDVDFASFYFVIERVKGFSFFIVGIKTNDFRSFKEFF